MGSKSPWGARENKIWLLGGSVKQQHLHLSGGGGGGETAQKPHCTSAIGPGSEMAL